LTFQSVNRKSAWVETLLTISLFCVFQSKEDLATAEEKSATPIVQIDKLLASGKSAEADSVVRQFLLKQPPSASVFLEIGRLYFEHDQWKQASELLRKSVELQNRNDVAHLLLGLSLAELKQFEESERELQIAVQQNPTSDFNWYFAGWRLLLRGKYEESLPYFYKAVELNPSNPNAYRALGQGLAHTGNYPLAENYYRKGIELVEREGQATPEPYLDLAYLLLFSNQKEPAAQALEYTRKAIAINSKIGDAHYLCGKALLKLERYSEANEELLIATRLNTKDGRPYFLLAQVYDRLGNVAKAREARKSFARLTQRRADESDAIGNLRP
jgi:Flp pilus assembly protein TadD